MHELIGIQRYRRSLIFPDVVPGIGRVGFHVIHRNGIVQPVELFVLVRVAIHCHGETGGGAGNGLLISVILLDLHEDEYAEIK